MTDEPNTAMDPVATLQERLDQANNRLVQSELKNHAIRAGMIDLDLLKLIDTSALKPNGNGDIPEAMEALSKLQREKPWMFANSSSSQPTPAPAPEPLKTRNALAMTRTEWQAARERLLRRR